LICSLSHELVVDVNYLNFTFGGNFLNHHPDDVKSSSKKSGKETVKKH